MLGLDHWFYGDTEKAVLRRELDECKAELKRWRALQPSIDRLADVVDAEPGVSPMNQAVFEIKALRAKLAAYKVAIASIRADIEDLLAKQD